MKRKYLILIPIIILFIISIIYLPNNLKIKQSIWIFLSLIILLIISNINIKKLMKYSIIYYIICLILLALILLLNKSTNGSRAWIEIGSISIQPSEFMKISLILLSIRYYKKINIYLFFIIYLIPIILIFLEPDTGGIISLLIIFIYFFIKKLDKKQLFKIFILLSILFICICLFIYNNQDAFVKIIGPSIFYRIDRIINFIRDDNIQTTNALISIATGNTLYFPEMFNDFFIAYILSKNIYLIILIILSTILLLFMLKKKNTLVSQVAFYLVLWQCYYNLAMNLKLVPVIGIPYLFLSYGGSHIISSMILIALVINSKDKS